MPHDVEHYRKHVEHFLTDTQEARFASERARDYVDNKQWTAEEESKLRARGQAAIVVNRCAPKVAGLLGLLIQRKTDPKAYPRTQAHEDSANAITDALRFVADNVDFDQTKLDVAEDFFVEGYGGAIVEVKRAGDDVEVAVNRIPWDRIYYDPHSRRYDFKDARYMGITLWMDRDVARQKYGDRVDACMSDAAEGDTFDDRPRWILSDKGRDRIFIALEFLQTESGWETAMFCGDTFLVDPMPSPFLDEDGEPTNPIELVAAHIDRENRRFGEVAYWLDLQDEINHRRSKALHLLSVRQTAGRSGAVADIDAMKRELAKANGHVEYDGEKGDFEILPTGDMASVQLNLLEEAKGEIDAVGYNAQLSGERQGSLSGRAILALQAGGSNELAAQFGRLNGWEKRIYRQIWTRIRQFWDRERWIRVTDEERKLRFVGFNVEQTLQEVMEEQINDESVSELERKPIAEQFMAMMQAQDPRLQQVVQVKNPVAELDVDIILEQSLDSVNTQQEQFELMANIAQSRPEVPFTTLLRLSTFREKDELIAKIEEGTAAQQQSLEAQAQAEAEALRQATAMELEKGLMLQQQKINSTERIKAAELAFEREKAALTIDVDNNRAEASRNIAPTLKIPDAGSLVAAMENLADSNRDTTAVQELIAALQKPRTVARDDEGRVIGIV